MCPIWVSQVAHLLTSDLAEVGLNRVQIRQLQKLAGSSGVAWRPMAVTSGLEPTVSIPLSIYLPSGELT